MGLILTCINLTFFGGNKNSSCCLLQTKWLMKTCIFKNTQIFSSNYMFIYRTADIFFFKKNCQMKEGQSVWDSQQIYNPLVHNRTGQKITQKLTLCPVAATGLQLTCWMTTMTLTQKFVKTKSQLIRSQKSLLETATVVRSRFQHFAAFLEVKVISLLIKSLKCNHQNKIKPSKVTPKPVIVKRTKRLPGTETQFLFN